MQGKSYAACPFCSYQAAAARTELLAINDLSYHIETQHPEDEKQESPFLLRPSTSQSPNSANLSQSQSQTDNKEPLGYAVGKKHLPLDVGSNDFVDCPQNCGELLPPSELPSHLALHDAEDAVSDEFESLGASGEQHDHGSDFFEAKEQRAEITDDGSGHIHNKKRLAKLFAKVDRRSHHGTATGVSEAGHRLGKKELGPYAYEDHMPTWLFRQLERGPPVTWVNQFGSDGKVHRVEKVANETAGLINFIARSCNQDKNVSKAWLCSPGVKHIFKMRREGGFCGYRNIQMLVSWIQHHQHPGHGHFPGSTPNIFQLQEMIEEAWDKGFNETGRIETGGIVGTRKFIGTPEAQALFQSLGIECHTMAVTKSTSVNKDVPVYKVLIEHVLRYFAQGVQNPSDKVYQTHLPPLYFQHPGHSLTIVGLEIHKDASVKLLVFDPMFATSSMVIRYLNSNASTSRPERVLRSFRRGQEYLEKYRSFEFLGLTELQKTPAEVPDLR